jgi:signal transduction histidine kinase
VSAEGRPGPPTVRSKTVASFFLLAVVVPTILTLAAYAYRDWRTLELELLIWVVLIAAVELLPASTWNGIQVSLGFPLLAAVAITYPPGVAAIVAFLGSFDPREFRRDINPLRALFNRSQVTLAVLAASAVFHQLSNRGDPLVYMIPAALVATVVDYAINISLVSFIVAIVHRMSVRVVFRELSHGQEFLISYVGLGLVGTVLAKLFDLPGVGFWSIAVVLAPLLFARQMFIRTQALEEAHKELQAREELLRQLSNTMAQERADERLQIAGYLHDDLAQVLFRLSIQVDVARKLLEKKDMGNLSDQLDKIRDSKQETSDRVRALIRDLHRSPLGAKGLSEAMESFTDEVGRESGVVFHHDVEDIDLPAPIALLIYHIAREAVMNALKHAGATDMWVMVRERDDDIELRIRDNGVGFATDQPGPEGHFGMSMMRERAQVGGGTFHVESAPGQGTTITVKFPIALLHVERQDEQDGSGPGDANTPGRASPGTTGTTEREVEDSRGSVPA